MRIFIFTTLISLAVIACAYDWIFIAALLILGAVLYGVSLKRE